MGLDSSLKDLSTFFRIWFISGTVALLTPLIIFTVARLRNRDGGEQQQEEENADGCHWYNWNCGEEQGSNDNTPWWWFSDGRRDPEEGNPALIVAYVYCVLLFCCLLHFGFNGIKNGRARVVGTALFFWSNLCAVSMLILRGTLEMDGPEMEGGFYGQVSMLLFLSLLMWMLFGLLFICLLRRRSGESVTMIEVDPSDYQEHKTAVCA